MLTTIYKPNKPVRSYETGYYLYDKYGQRFHIGDTVVILNGIYRDAKATVTRVGYMLYNGTTISFIQLMVSKYNQDVKYLLS